MHAQAGESDDMTADTQGKQASSDLKEGGVVLEGPVLHQRLAAAVVLRDDQRAQDGAQVLYLHMHARRLALPARDVHLRPRLSPSHEPPETYAPPPLTKPLHTAHA